MCIRDRHQTPAREWEGGYRFSKNSDHGSFGQDNSFNRPSAFFIACPTRNIILGILGNTGRNRSLFERETVNKPDTTRIISVPVADNYFQDVFGKIRYFVCPDSVTQ